MAQSVNQPVKLRTLESDAYNTQRDQTSVSPLRKEQNGQSSVNILLDVNSIGDTRQSTNVGASTTVGFTGGAVA